ncbi:phosphoribosylglycinamide formyltransferase-1 [Amphibacillus marinus]|uniref:Phosphoribosylglycinamide formyltransferase n=1 Tax=Amphibacillus marinus TaxID=872970 RepID=A0A1H8LHE6_9BACI|nr:phosphoribosylglycinamide formyltransferase [Amphibacillus marinus]SEO04580.1 phosphoribosylglycinamide formyltransferase-1 [Amphibacillus marinus]
MRSKQKLAIFASGTGSNYDAIHEAIQTGELEAELVLLVCDRPQALVIKKAADNGLPVFVFNPRDYSTKADFEAEIVKQLKKAAVEWIILAGYMRLIGTVLLECFEGRIINIHPSLLPAFPGLDAIGQAFDAGVKVSGVTIHYVDAGMDTGQIIAQQAVAIKPNMTRPALQSAIQLVEHELYPRTIQQLLTQGE